MTDVRGTVARGFEDVREAFAKGQADDRGGAQLCVYRGGEVVVDLWTGTDVVNARPYTADTVTVLMSCTKAVVAMCAHLLAQRGLLELEAPVARYWPEFAANEKGDVRVAQLLDHSVGLMGFDPDAPRLDAEDTLQFDTCARALAAMKPLWSPGSAYMYHFITYGYLVGEVIRRVSGQSVGRFVAREFAGPLSLDLWIGMPERFESRVAPHFRSNVAMREEGLRDLFAAGGIDVNERLVRAAIDAMVTTEGLIELMTTRAGRAAEVPAGNGIGNARSLAKLYAAAIGEVDGVHFLTPETLRAACVPRTDALKGPRPLHELRGSPQRFGLGFELPRDICPMLGDGSFGHPGAGGRLAFAHPGLGVSAAYVCNNLLWDGFSPDPRWRWNQALRQVVGV
jgi:CubicO group peptidase (beta-lactamase class C family)